MSEALIEKRVLMPVNYGSTALAILLLWLVLLFPSHPENFVIGTLLKFPVELAAIVLLLSMLPKRLTRWLCLTLVALMGSLLLLRLADIGSYLAFNRRFNPLLEMHLITDGWNLASTSIGLTQAIAIILIALCLLLVFSRILYRCMTNIASVPDEAQNTQIFIATLALLSAAIALTAQSATDKRDSVFNAGIVPEIHQRFSDLRKSIRDQRQFVQDLQSDDVLDVSQPRFSALDGKDVIILFIESYGRGFVDAERFTRASHDQLIAAERNISDAGLSVKSGWFESPIRGGRSWLAHASLHSGLKIDSQARYDRLITSNRETIADLFENAGWQSIGIMPAIQFEWPESAWYSYDNLHVNADLAYQGERFGYVTMPDQYTLSHFEHNIRRQADTPVMVTMALLSTHAPWTPLPLKLDWDQVGDGSIYDGSNRFGERISWKYRSQVQDMYIRSFDYTLDIVSEYVARYAEDSLIVIMGDHQPAPVINGWGKSADVPVHFIARDKALLDRLPMRNWTDGMIPSSDSQSVAMWDARRLFSTLFE